ncbi:30S ribosomal protein S6 [Buchnera aphidicola]|uniref:30S ribosomal protein S6 n=1 Tax=Buchnera aphidicola TaxID=9 RepID=UPI0031B872DE
MRHYEIILMIHPDQTIDQVINIINEYKKFVKKHSGIIHRLEDWGRRQLSYAIKKLHKAHYVLLNIELNTDSMVQLKEKLYFDSVIIRNLIIHMKNSIKTVSPMLKLKDEKKRY